MHHRHCLLMTLTILALLSGAPDAAAQSSTQPDATATTECRDTEAEAEDLATELAECMLGRSRARGETSGQATAHATVVAGLRVDVANERARGDRLALKLDRAPDPILVGGVGAVLGAGVVALVWWLAVR
jgi:hypothetical protein